MRMQSIEMEEPVATSSLHFNQPQHVSSFPPKWNWKEPQGAMGSDGLVQGPFRSPLGYRTVWLSYVNSLFLLFLERRKSWSGLVRAKWLFCTAVMKSLLRNSHTPLWHGCSQILTNHLIPADFVVRKCQTGRQTRAVSFYTACPGCLTLPTNC